MWAGSISNAAKIKVVVYSRCCSKMCSPNLF